MQKIKQGLFLFLLFITGHNIFAMHAMADQIVLIKNNTTIPFPISLKDNNDESQYLQSMIPGETVSVAPLAYKRSILWYCLTLQSMDGKDPLSLWIAIIPAMINELDNHKKWAFWVETKRYRQEINPKYENETFIVNITEEFLKKVKLVDESYFLQAKKVNKTIKKLEKIGIAYSIEAFNKCTEIKIRADDTTSGCEDKSMLEEEYQECYANSPLSIMGDCKGIDSHFMTMKELKQIYYRAIIDAGDSLVATENDILKYMGFVFSYLEYKHDMLYSGGVKASFTDIRKNYVCDLLLYFLYKTIIEKSEHLDDTTKRILCEKNEYKIQSDLRKAAELLSNERHMTSMLLFYR